MAKRKSKVDLSKRTAAFVSLSDFCTFSMGENKNRGDYLEVTEWTNGEGFDIDIHTGSNNLRFQLTEGQFDAIKECIKLLYN